MQKGQNRHQQFIAVTNTFRLQHRSPTSMLPIIRFGLTISFKRWNFTKCFNLIVWHIYYCCILWKCSWNCCQTTWPIKWLNTKLSGNQSESYCMIRRYLMGIRVHTVWFMPCTMEKIFQKPSIVIFSGKLNLSRKFQKSWIDKRFWLSIKFKLIGYFPAFSRLFAPG